MPPKLLNDCNNGFRLFTKLLICLLIWLFISLEFNLTEALEVEPLIKLLINGVVILTKLLISFRIGSVLKIPDEYDDVVYESQYFDQLEEMPDKELSQEEKNDISWTWPYF